jgi:hypothetical protein
MMPPLIRVACGQTFAVPAIALSYTSQFLAIYAWTDGGTGARRERDVVTLDELVLAVEHHRQQMASIVDRLAVAIDGDAARDLVCLLEGSDRQLGNLCHRLSDHLQGLEQPAVRGANEV